MAQHLVVAGFLHVEDLALQRQDGLEAAIASLLCGAACGLTLDQEEFAAVGIALRAISQLARQSAAIERAFATRQVAGLACGFASACGFNGFVDDLARNRRVLFKEG